MTAFRPRVIPCLLLDGYGLVKTVKFGARTYLGDPINTVRLFNDKGADEIALLDINASAKGTGPQFDVLEEIASEAFMPLSYGGGVTTLEQIRRILGLGYEKVVLNTVAIMRPDFIDEAARVFGRSTIVVSIDVRRPRLGGPRVRTPDAYRGPSLQPASFAADLARRGAGEIFLTAVDRDGTGIGYDLDLVSDVSAAVNVPVVACGGAGSVADLGRGITAGASAVAAGTIFVFNGKHRAVLITYPRDADLAGVFPIVSRTR